MNALDSMTIIWGLKISGGRRGNPTQPGLGDLRVRARILLEMLEEEKPVQKILFSTVALAEVLVRVDEKNQQQFIDKAQEKFFCPSFDLPASALAAKLWLINHKLPSDEQISRLTLKADIQIIATAAVHGAKRFYTYDKKARKLADAAGELFGGANGMKGFDLPTKHPDMNVDADIRAELAKDESDEKESKKK